MSHWLVIEPLKKRVVFFNFGLRTGSSRDHLRWNCCLTFRPLFLFETHSGPVKQYFKHSMPELHCIVQKGNSPRRIFFSEIWLDYLFLVKCEHIFFTFTLYTNSVLYLFCLHLHCVIQVRFKWRHSEEKPWRSNLKSKVRFVLLGCLWEYTLWFSARLLLKTALAVRSASLWIFFTRHLSHCWKKLHIWHLCCRNSLLALLKIIWKLQSGVAQGLVAIKRTVHLHFA